MLLRPTLSEFLLAGLTAPAVSQSGTVRYDQAVKLEFNLPPAGRMPLSKVRPMLLTFSPEMVL